MASSLPVLGRALLLLTMLCGGGLASGAEFPPFGGSVECPCILDPDYFAGFSESSEVESSFLPGGFDPDNYGRGCSVGHFANEIECQPVEHAVDSPCYNVVPAPPGCETDPPAWCKESAWCYVDPERCSLEAIPARWFVSQGRYYSFSTCGSVNYLAGEELANTLKGKALRVGYFQNSGGVLGAFHPVPGHQTPAHRDDRWSGAYKELLDRLCERAGCIINNTIIPESFLNHAVNFTGNSFTAGAMVTGQGFIDVGAASFAASDKRLQLASMQIMESSGLYLTIKAGRGHGDYNWDAILLPFLPFTFGVWAAVVVFASLFTAAFMWQEKLGACAEKYKHDGCLHPTANIVAEATVRGLSGLAGAPPHAMIETDNRLGSKISVVGIVWFTMLFVAFYSANLTNLLVTATDNGHDKTFTEMLSRGSKFCVPRSYLAEFLRKYPSIQIMIDPADGRAGILSRHDLVKYVGNVDNPDGSPRCSAALITDEVLAGAQSEGDYCDVIRVGDPVLMNHRGVPLYGEHEQALRYFFQFIDRDGEWDVIKEKYYSLEKRMCKGIVKDFSGSLGFESVVGSFVLVTLLFLLGLLTTCYERRGAHAASEDPTSEEAAPIAASEVALEKVASRP